MQVFFLEGRTRLKKALLFFTIAGSGKKGHYLFSGLHLRIHADYALMTQ